MINKNEKVFVLIIFIIIGVLFYILNYYTPLYVDDYSYSFSFMDGGKINNIKELLLSQKAHYLSMNGRSITHTIAQIFLCHQKAFFNFFNTIIYISLILVIYFHSYGTLKNFNSKWILFIFLMLWIITPNFGQSYLWVTGASNYLYGILIILLYLIPFRKINKQNDNEIKSPILKFLILILYGLIGIIAGWTNENTGVALICISVMYLIMFKIRGIKINSFMISGLIGNFIGFSLMIFAPGQRNRLNNSGGIGESLELIKRGMFISIELMKYLTPMFIFLAILLIYYYFSNKNTMKFTDMIDELAIGIIFFIGSLASIYSMIVSPSFPERTWSGPIILLVISLGNIFSKIKFDKKYEIGTVVILSILCLFFSTSYIEAILKLRQTRVSFDNRVDQIMYKKDNNINDVIIPTIIGYSKYDCYTSFGDLSNNSNEWPNTAIAKYYGVKSISKEKE